MSKAKFTPGPWSLCHHLKSIEHDKSCPCGFRGSIGGPDGEHTICEMGSSVIPGEEGLESPRYDRETEIANAHLIASAPELFEALKAIIDSGEIPYCYSSPLVVAANKALAKAKGEQQ